MILLWSKACHADKEDVVVNETFPCPPFLARGLGTSIAARWNTVRDYAAPSNPV